MAINRSDHDILITVETKVDQLNQQVKDLTSNKVSEHTLLENRLAKLERIAVEYDGGKYVPMIEKHEQWIHDFRLQWRITIAYAVVIASVVTTVLTLVFKAFCIFGRCS